LFRGLFVGSDVFVIHLLRFHENFWKWNRLIVFAGFEFSGTEQLDFASEYKAAESTFHSTAGIEQSGHTLSVQFEYQIIKYGSVDPVNSIKSKNGYITAAMGQENGLRYLICVGYLTEVEDGGAAYSRRNEGGTILLQVARAQ
jgi:hypothetical protein